MNNIEDSNVAQFMSITGATSDDAKIHLINNNNNISLAVENYLNNFDNNNNNNKRKHNELNNNNDDIRAPIPHRKERLVSSFIHDPFRSNRSSRRSSNRPSPWDDSKALNKLYRPPIDLISNIGGFNESCTIAADTNKWLLINIQSHDQFDSFRLNRDTWSDTNVQLMIRKNFIFLQYDLNSDDASYYIRYYNPYKYPHIGILDPRTKQKLDHREGFVGPNELAVWLHSFLQSNSFKSTIETTETKSSTQKKSRLVSTSNSFKPSTTTKIEKSSMNNNVKKQKVLHELSYEEQLRLVMEESLKETHENDLDVDKINEHNNKNNNEVHITNDENKKIREFDPQQFLQLYPLPESNIDSTRIQIRLNDGTLIRRRFHKTDPVKVLYEFVRYKLYEKKIDTLQKFILVTTYPKKTIPESNISLQDANMLNSSLHMSILDEN